MDWKMILHENLLILGFKLEKSEQIDLFKTDNKKAFLCIIMFLISQENPIKHQELTNKSLIVKDKVIQREYLKDLYNWCIQLITKTFKDFSVSITLFQSPHGIKVYEFLGKLTSSFIKLCIEKENVNNEIECFRYPIVLNDIRKLKIPSNIMIKSLKDDLFRETQAYIGYLNMLVTRKAHMDKLIKEICQRLELKKKSITDIQQEFIDVINSNKVDKNFLNFLDNQLDYRVQKIDDSMKRLQIDMDKCYELCNEIRDLFDNREDLVTIKMTTTKIFDKVNSNLISEEGKVCVDKVVQKLAMKLSSDRLGLGDGFQCPDIERLSNGIVHIKSTIKDKLMECEKSISKLDVMKSEITNKSNELDECNLTSYGRLPNIASLLEHCVHINDDIYSQQDWIITDVDKLKLFANYSGKKSLTPSNNDSDSDLSELSDDNNDYCISEEILSSVDNINGNKSPISPQYLLRTPINQNRQCPSIRESIKNSKTIRDRQSIPFDNSTSPIKFISINDELSHDDYVTSNDNLLDLSTNSNGDFFDKSDDSIILEK